MPLRVGPARLCSPWWRSRWASIGGGLAGHRLARPRHGTALLAAWNLLVGLWLGDEAIRLRRGEAEGIESIVLGCALTAVLAGVGLSRDLAAPGRSS